MSRCAKGQAINLLSMVHNISDDSVTRHLRLPIYAHHEPCRGEQIENRTRAGEVRFDARSACALELLERPAFNLRRIQQL